MLQIIEVVFVVTFVISLMFGLILLVWSLKVTGRSVNEEQKIWEARLLKTIRYLMMAVPDMDWRGCATTFGNDVVIADAQGQPVADQITGELLVRGDNVLSGYYKNDQASRTAFWPGGWFRTGDIGYFKIMSETSISAGVRRIEALTGKTALNLSQESHDKLDSLALKLNTSSEEVIDKISQLIDTNKTLKQDLDKLRSSSLSATASDMSLESEEIAGLKVIAKKMEGLDSSVLRETADKLRNKEKNSLIVLVSIFEDKVPIVIATHKELDQIDAREVMNHLVSLLGGSGGGRSDFAQGGVEKVEDIEIVLASLSEFLVSLSS